MKMSVKMVGASELKRTLDKFAQLTGKGVERGIDEMALSSARALAIKVQPYGLTASQGRKFEKSIRAQVERVWFGVNVGAFPATNDMRQAHYQARRNGVVPKRLFRKENGKPWLNMISKQERDRYAERQIKKAGRAKAAWITAGESLKIGKISGVAKWIREDTGKYGTSLHIGKMLKAKVELGNKTPYLSNLQKSSDIQTALRQGRQNGLKRMKKIIAAELKKIK